jgi:hypothetical protein
MHLGRIACGKACSKSHCSSFVGAWQWRPRKGRKEHWLYLLCEPCFQCFPSQTPDFPFALQNIRRLVYELTHISFVCFSFAVFTTFWPLGLIAFGGPPAHVVILRDHLVVQRDWLEEEQFTELFAIGQVS